MISLNRFLVALSIVLGACSAGLPDHVSFGSNADLFRGPDHCDWQSTWFVLIESDDLVDLPNADMPGWHMFVRDPEEIPQYQFDVLVDLDRQLPTDAELLGENEGFELWYSTTDPNYMFVTDGKTTEAWTRAAQWGLCA